VFLVAKAPSAALEAKRICCPSQRMDVVDIIATGRVG